LRSGVELMPRGKRRDALAQANKSGNPIGFPDAAIAAISLLHGFQVATRNVVDFSSTGANIINPWENKDY
jgi:predicted nucleic acid-binding protein